MSVSKYRMWDGKKMFQNHEIKHYELGVLQGTSYEMMSSTRLFDKSGVEIYEGDIVKFIPDGSFGEVKIFNKSLCMGIEWENPKTTFFTQLFYLECESELEIIGNIHENKGLLK